jgi:hypothetical protein
MKKTSVEYVFRWALAAWMLLATSATSSTYAHCHRGGNVSHQHGRAECAHLHSTVPARMHSEHHDNLRLASRGHVHRCVMLLGGAVPLPTNGERADSHGKQANSFETILVISAAPNVRNLSKSIATGQDFLAPLDNLSVESVSAAGHATSPSSFVVTVPWLCARARHERSGVQLS